MNTIDVAHMQAGDYVVAEFRELTIPQWYEWFKPPKPTGRTYILEGPLKEYDGIQIEGTGLAMPNGQAVRQVTGRPGGNLVRILSYTPKESNQ